MSDIKKCGRCGQMTIRSPLCVDCEIYMKTHYEPLPTDPILKRVIELEKRLEKVIEIVAGNNKAVRIESIYESALKEIAESQYHPAWDRPDARRIALAALTKADAINETETE